MWEELELEKKQDNEVDNGGETEKSESAYSC